MKRYYLSPAIRQRLEEPIIARDRRAATQELRNRLQEELTAWSHLELNPNDVIVEEVTSALQARLPMPFLL
jgi:hypothetical protein